MNPLKKAIDIKRGVVSKVKGAIDRRLEIQKNYENRTAKGDYYKSAKHFK